MSGSPHCLVQLGNLRLEIGALVGEEAEFAHVASFVAHRVVVAELG